jgi:MFS family permease
MANTSHLLVKTHKIWNDLKEVPKDVWGIGIANMFINLSTVMIFSMASVYMIDELGASPFIVFLWDSVLQTIALISRIFSGLISDYFRNRKSLLMIGYGMAALSRLVLAVSVNLPIFMVGHLFDRLGNGVQAAPRDALIGDIAPKHISGECYGLRQTLAVVGSVMGPVATIYIMLATNNDYKSMFFWSFIPALVGVLAIWLMVREPVSVKTKNETPKRHLPNFSDMVKLPKAFWLVIGLSSFFTLARYGESLLILQSKNLGLVSEKLPLVMLVMNVFTFLSAYPLGALSDRYDRRWVLGLSFIALIVSDLFMGLSSTLLTGIPGIDLFGLSLQGPLLGGFIGIAFWGIQLGGTMTILSTMVADTTRPELRATAFGIFYLTSGLVHLVSGSWAGYVWEHISPSATYLVGAGITFLSLCAIYILPSFSPKER